MATLAQEVMPIAHSVIVKQKSLNPILALFLITWNLVSCQIKHYENQLLLSVRRTFTI